LKNNPVILNYAQTWQGILSILVISKKLIIIINWRKILNQQNSDSAFLDTKFYKIIR